MPLPILSTTDPNIYLLKTTPTSTPATTTFRSLHPTTPLRTTLEASISPSTHSTPISTIVTLNPYTTNPKEISYDESSLSSIHYSPDSNRFNEKDDSFFRDDRDFTNPTPSRPKDAFGHSIFVDPPSLLNMPPSRNLSSKTLHGAESDEDAKLDEPGERILQPPPDSNFHDMLVEVINECQDLRKANEQLLEMVEDL
ncbi:hypothetical protein BC829DRAFT_398928, partial [Chytridium lagenaria]